MPLCGHGQFKYLAWGTIWHFKYYLSFLLKVIALAEGPELKIGLSFFVTRIYYLFHFLIHIPKILRGTNAKQDVFLLISIWLILLAAK